MLTLQLLLSAAKAAAATAATSFAMMFLMAKNTSNSENQRQDMHIISQTRAFVALPLVMIDFYDDFCTDCDRKLDSRVKNVVFVCEFVLVTDMLYTLAH